MRHGRPLVILAAGLAMWAPGAARADTVTIADGATYQVGTEVNLPCDTDEHPPSGGGPGQTFPEHSQDSFLYRDEAVPKPSKTGWYPSSPTNHKWLTRSQLITRVDTDCV